MTVRPTPIKGVYFDPFWEFVQERRLRVQRCQECGHQWFPPSAGCPECLSEDWQWLPVAGSGRLVSWAVFHKQYFPSLPPPYTIVAVELDEGPILVADIGEGDVSSSLVQDEPMELVYEDATSVDGDDFLIYRWRRQAEAAARA
jgi:uncharacterized OB-fold protein